MGCSKKNKRATKENVEKIADNYTRVSGIMTETFVKIIGGVEVYDYQLIRDEKGNIIYTDKQDERKEI